MQCFLRIVNRASLICSILAFTHALQAEDKFIAVSNSDGTTILEGIRPVLTFQKSVTHRDGKWPRNNYVHPLYDLDGRIITEDFPADHGHHRGIFWAWHQVLAGDNRLGDAWLCEDFQWQVMKVLPRQEGDVAIIETEVLWQSSALVDKSGTPIPVVREQTEIRVHLREEHYRAIDFRIRLIALVEDLKIGGSEDTKGYGGFSPRIQLKDTYTFSGTEGVVEPQTNAVAAGPWINIGDDKFGFAIVGHPDNPNHPQPWILRRQRSMQNPVYPGQHAQVVSMDKPLTLRYRTIIHDGTLTSDQLDAMTSAFHSE